MVSDHKEKLYIQRARNELSLAKVIFKISTNDKQKPEFELKEDTTFFSNVISQAYYCIFYSAKALLHYKGIETKSPEEHKKLLMSLCNMDKNI